MSINSICYNYITPLLLFLLCMDSNYIWDHLLSLWRTSFSISCKASLLAMKSLFFFSENVYALPSLVKNNFVWWIDNHWTRIIHLFFIYLQFYLDDKWQPTPAFLPGESHGRRSLVGYSPWGRKESDMTERLHGHVHKEL